MRPRHALTAAAIGTLLVTGAMAVPAQALPNGGVAAPAHSGLDDLASVALGGGVTMEVSTASPSEYDCPRVHTTGRYAYTWCRVYKGKVRLIADCNGPDAYSSWIYPQSGNPTQRLQAGPCNLGLGPNSGVQGAA
ncbi:hypothetical protein [Streptomyces mirabilis]|uniref:hypothetical protein n=1 Tax=Streptomyces mirabilis TaxID=68239 RepID=UPI0036D87A09